jgi:3',5'-cyclic-AMP phosphodiesterase
MTNRSETNEQHDGIDRRGFLKCMAWAGTGLVWTVTAGGLLSACTLPGAATDPAVKGFTFVQVSDSHIGFSVPGVTTDVTKTLEEVVGRINVLATPPTLVLHTGDLTQLSKPAQFDTTQQVMSTIKTQQVLYVPGEHDVIGDNGAEYRRRFVPQSRSTLWYSTDYNGIHFIGLSNIGVENVFGALGADQIAWLGKDLQGVSHDTPIVVFAHVPLYAVYPPWGWTTTDAAQALDLLKPFSSVTVLNGHIHQVLSQVEGNIRIYTANSTAYPQHHPGVVGPGPFKLPPDELLRSIGYRTITVVPGQQTLAIVDTTLG